MTWFQHQLQLLCPPSNRSLRLNAESAADFVTQLYNEEQHGRPFLEFLQSADEKPLFVALLSTRQLTCSSTVPKQGTYEAVLYLLKPTDAENITWNAKSLARHLQVRQQCLSLLCTLAAPHSAIRAHFAAQCGMLHRRQGTCVVLTEGSTLQVGLLKDKDPMEGLERLMKSVFAPLILNNTTWPDSIRKDMSASLHKLLASLVQCVNERKGDTVLYIPHLNLAQSPAIAAADKETLQLTESCVIHATRQVKDVLNRQDDASHGSDTGPLQEIAFWRARSEDLCRIRDQLDSTECQHMVKVCAAHTPVWPPCQPQSRVRQH